MAEANTEEWLQNVQFISERQRDLFVQARFGETVKDFLVSEVGRYLHGRSKIRFEECKDLIIGLDPDADDFHQKFRQLRNEAWAAEHFMQWCVDAIQDADQAARNLDEEDLLE